VSTPADSATALVRVEKGHAEPEELAAITAILLARAKAAGAAPAGHRPARSTAGWRRLERQTGFNAPHSWRS
jgi:Acyl-CoA carboxylase epsilon subunit